MTNRLSFAQLMDFLQYEFSMSTFSFDTIKIELFNKIHKYSDENKTWEIKNFSKKFKGEYSLSHSLFCFCFDN